MKTQRMNIKNLRNLVKEILKEEIEKQKIEEVLYMYDDNDGDEEYEKETKKLANDLYDVGLKFYKSGDKEEAEEYRKKALEVSAKLGWNDTDLLPYKYAS